MCTLAEDPFSSDLPLSHGMQLLRSWRLTEGQGGRRQPDMAGKQNTLTSGFVAQSHYLKEMTYRVQRQNDVLKPGSGGASL